MSWRERKKEKLKLNQMAMDLVIEISKGSTVYMGAIKKLASDHAKLLDQPKGKLNPITLDGVLYQRTKDVVEKYGVGVRTVAKWRKDYSAFEEYKLRKELKLGAACKPISIQGVEYPSMKYAAEVLGVKYATLVWAKKNGTLDSLGGSK